MQPARLEVVVVRVGLEGHPFLDPGYLGDVAQDVGEGPLEDLLFGHGPQPVGVSVRVKEAVASLQPGFVTNNHDNSILGR